MNFEFRFVYNIYTYLNICFHNIVVFLCIFHIIDNFGICCYLICNYCQFTIIVLDVYNTIHIGQSRSIQKLLIYIIPISRNILCSKNSYSMLQTYGIRKVMGLNVAQWRWNCKYSRDVSNLFWIMFRIIEFHLRMRW